MLCDLGKLGLEERLVVVERDWGDCLADLKQELRIC